MKIKHLLFFSLILCLTIIFTACNNNEKVNNDPAATKKPIATANSTAVKTASAAPTATPKPTETPAPTASADVGVNIAVGKNKEVSSKTENAQGWTVNAVNDGVIEAQEGIHVGWTSEVNKYIEGNFDEKDVNEWVVIDLGKEYNITRVVAWPRQTPGQEGLYFPVDYQVEVSNDNKTWTKVYTKTDDNGAEDFNADARIIDLTNAKGRYVRFMGTKLTNVNSITPNDGLLMQLAELEIYSKDK
jgi:hypothetical protein